MGAGVGLLCPQGVGHSHLQHKKWRRWSKAPGRAQTQGWNSGSPPSSGTPVPTATGPWCARGPFLHDSPMACPAGTHIPSEKTQEKGPVTVFVTSPGVTQFLNRSQEGSAVHSGAPASHQGEPDNGSSAAAPARPGQPAPSNQEPLQTSSRCSCQSDKDNPTRGRVINTIPSCSAHRHRIQSVPRQYQLESLGEACAHPACHPQALC